MKSLSRNEWIAVAAGVVLIAIVFFAPGLFGLGKPAAQNDGASQPTQEAPTAPAMNDTATAGIVDEVIGTGAEAKAGSSVEVLYVGMFADGKIFDSSALHGGAPLPFTVGQGVIAGFSQGVTGMKVGGKRKVTIPPNLGYGANDYGPIPGGSTLIFELQLVSVK